MGADGRRGGVEKLREVFRVEGESVSRQMTSLESRVKNYLELNQTTTIHAYLENLFIPTS